MSKARAGKDRKKSSSNSVSWMGSLFKKEEPKLAKTPDEFVGLPRPGW